MKFTVSKQSFKQKASSADYKGLEFFTAELNKNNLLSVIREGRMFSGVYNQENFSVKDKTKANWIGQNFVAIDIEGDGVPALNDALLNSIEVVPSIAYTTFSNGIKGNRYRFIYILEEKITTEYELKRIYDNITRMLYNSGIFTVDNCGATADRMFQGSSRFAYISGSFNIFSVHSFDAYSSECETEGTTEKEAEKTEERRRRTEVDFDLGFDESFENDIKSLSNVDFVKKYNTVYRYRTSNRDQLNYDKNGIAFLGEDNQLFELNRRFSGYKEIRKSQDGERRRKELYVKALLLLKIEPTISAAELYYNLAEEVVRFVDNSKDKINYIDLKRIVSYALDAQEEGRNNIKASTKKFCLTKGSKKFNAKRIGMARRQLTWNNIKGLINKKLTAKENLQVIKNNGIKISLNTLKAYMRANKINLVTTSQINYNKVKAAAKKAVKATVREIAKMVELGKSTVQKYLQIIKAELSKKAEKIDYKKVNYYFSLVKEIITEKALANYNEYKALNNAQMTI